MKYFIVETYSSRELERIVGEYIAKGWIPQGGVCKTRTDYSTTYTQAMVKLDEPYIDRTKG